MNFDPQLAILLPETYELLTSANLVVHPSVSRVVLHGSRGLAGSCRPDSDIDLSLIVGLPQEELSETFFNDVTRTTLDHWHSSLEIDLAVVFDLKQCGLKCFQQTIWKRELCSLGGVDCFGLYKIQKGFHGFVKNAGIQVRLMVPCLTIWQRKGY